MENRDGYYIRHFSAPGIYEDHFVVWPSKPIEAKEIKVLKDRVHASAKNNQLTANRVFLIEKDKLGNEKPVAQLYPEV